jgi:molecular chaperone GrpE
VTDQPLEPRLEDEEAQQEVEQEEVATEEPAEETPPAPADETAPAPVEVRDDAYLRLAADFDNYRKRVARDQAELYRRANERLLDELLPVLDDLERALEAAAQHEEAKLEEGVELVHRSLSALLARHGLTEIDADGAFDPHVHEAMLTQPADGAEDGSVLQVLQKGYRLGDRVLRPARVIVAQSTADQEA